MDIYIIWETDELSASVSETLLLYSVTHTPARGHPHGPGEQGARARQREALGMVGSGISIS